VEAITLVADTTGEPMPKVTTVVPPRWLVRLVGRAGAKLLCSVLIARRVRPAWVIGYNLVPHGVNAVRAARAGGARALIHLIGGAAEWEGGGWRGDNALLKRLPRPVPAGEALLLWVLRKADVVAVMGARGRQALLAREFSAERVRVLPASVDPARFGPARSERPRYQLVTVAALIPLKRLEDFLLAVAQLRHDHPELRAAIAGRGPLEAALRWRADELGIGAAVDFLGFISDTPSLYADSELFVLTSRTEGLSIAMTEAMIAGVPPIASAVGEAADLIRPGETGFLFGVGDVDALVHHAGALLVDPGLRRRIAQSAQAAALSVAARRRIAELNAEILVGSAASRSRPAAAAARGRPC
jgi:glycosyltransferase involved in cell wall biosynthesis